MRFDTPNEDKKNALPCPNCKSGNAIEHQKDSWHCDTCDWCFIKGGEEHYISQSEQNASGYIY